ncbi:MAG: ATP-binding protein [Halioglobus sp.]
MNLRRQLLLVSLLLLALPWAGCQFIREVETTLRDGQANSAITTTDAIASSLRDKPEVIYPDTRRERDLPGDDGGLFARVAISPVIVDGYTDDWDLADSQSRKSVDTNLAVSYQAQTSGDKLFLLFQVEDSEVSFHNPSYSREPNGDRITLVAWKNDRRQSYVISTAAPGQVRGQFASRREPGANASSIRGYWQDTANGYTVELTMPLDLTGARLGFYVTDVNRNTLTNKSSDISYLGNILPNATAAPPWLVYPTQELLATMDRFSALGSQVAVVDKSGRVLGSAGTPSDSPLDTDAQSTFWLLKLLYRAILSGDPLPSIPLSDAQGRLSSEEVTAALANRSEFRWYQSTNKDSGAILSAAAPILDNGVVVGSVVVQQGSERYLSLTDRAFGNMLRYGGATLLVAVLSLLLYASFLSWRIARLGHKVDEAIEDNGTIRGSFQGSNAKDEVGDLSRRFASLIQRVGEHNDYLRTLSSKLSHELRTPMAVIQSSLDNLTHPHQSSKERDIYIERARAGLQRLNAILNAMSEATGLEDSIATTDYETVDLSPLLQELIEAYRSAYNTHRFELALDTSANSERAEIVGSSDLLVQALDKLIDNATSFAPQGSTIGISLRNTPAENWSIEVTNAGAPLPATSLDNLFQPMVSFRKSGNAENNAPIHLGLGLHIVRLIALAMGGSVTARNIVGADKASKVRIAMIFPAKTQTV